MAGNLEWRKFFMNWKSFENENFFFFFFCWAEFCRMHLKILRGKPESVFKTTKHWWKLKLDCIRLCQSRKTNTELKNLCRTFYAAIFLHDCRITTEKLIKRFDPRKHANNFHILFPIEFFFWVWEVKGEMNF